MKRVLLAKPFQLEITDAPIPRPKRGEVQVKVTNCGICGSDPTIFKGDHPFCPPPVVMGHEFSGIIGALGEGVDDIKVGTRVTVLPHLTCGKCEMCRQHRSNLCAEVKCIGGQADGAHTEYVCLGREMVFPIPDNMSLDDAAMMEPACVGYHGARRAMLKPDDVVLVFGAGAIGNFAMQSCKAIGCKTVLIADYDSWRLNLAESLGADAAIDLNKETVCAAEKRVLGESRRIDVFFDCVGGGGGVLDAIIDCARRDARIVVIGVQSESVTVRKLPYIVEHELAIFGSNMYDESDYREMLNHMGNGKVGTKGMITHRFTLDRIRNAFDFVVGRKEPFFKVMLDIGG